jgi:hypothetical protein
MANAKKQRSRDIKELPFTFEQVMKELDKIARTQTRKRINLTDEQIQFLKKGKEKKIYYVTLAVLWERAGWGKASRSSMRRYCEAAMAGSKTLIDD